MTYFSNRSSRGYPVVPRSRLPAMYRAAVAMQRRIRGNRTRRALRPVIMARQGLRRGRSNFGGY